ncbi:MAG TPA: hypothetical protein VNM48_18360, partial [Chloroflexota bacterium]|nr:hypothetical protein [Chloroflexota bacterium]
MSNDDPVRSALRRLPWRRIPGFRSGVLWKQMLAGMAYAVMAFTLLGAVIGQPKTVAPRAVDSAPGSQQQVAVATPTPNARALSQASAGVANTATAEARTQATAAVAQTRAEATAAVAQTRAEATAAVVAAMAVNNPSAQDHMGAANSFKDAAKATPLLTAAALDEYLEVIDLAPNAFV